MISIIIPVLNEEKNLPALLSNFKDQDLKNELIFVDGGSTDKSKEIIKNTEHTFIRAKKTGRASQMNEGAQHAKGEILFFLHSDCELYPNVLSKIYSTLKQEKVIAGSFTMELCPGGPFYRIYEWFTRSNSIFFTYGDAGLFMKKETFNKLNGFADIPIMEDVEIQKRLRRMGKFKKIMTPIKTSSRRFRQNGSLFQILKNIYIILAWHLGVSAFVLKRIYPDDHR